MTTTGTGLTTIVDAVVDRGSRGIAEAVEMLIREGALAPGQRLATVRQIADELGVSAATVSIAWTELRKAGWLHTGRRRGTVVRGDPASDGRPWSEYPLDQALPDASLLPELDSAFASVVVCRSARHDTESMEPSLEAAAAATWPYAPAAFTVANGGYEGTLLALRATVPPGGAVAVEQPTAPRILQTLRAVRAVTIPVECDAEGPLPESLEAALFRRPDVFLFQPRSQVPTGSTLSEDRVDALNSVLDNAPSPVTVIEDDNIGPASSMPARSLATKSPNNLVLIRSYCKAYGVDIRTCVISGPHEITHRIERIRSLAMVGTNQILQAALAYLILDTHTEHSLEIARHRHRGRRNALATALHRYGVAAVEAVDGLALWVPVHDETTAVDALREHGIKPGIGSDCLIGDQHSPHLWFGTGSLPDSGSRITGLAARIVEAAQRSEQRPGLATVG